MANVQQLQKKKIALQESLSKFEESNKKALDKLNAQEEALEKKAVKAEEVLRGLDENRKEIETKKVEFENSSVGRKERLVEEIASLEKQIQDEVGALQAQIDAIRGTVTTDGEI